ncbi:MAG TPA: HD domain-containing phosphohydrolase [Gaiellaceae bacterium]|jgi:putative nucleotidyltransferase with HDIG domain
MLDALEPSAIPSEDAFAELEARARAIVLRRMQSIAVPDAHARTVAHLAADIAARIGLRRKDVETVVEGALLHDVGKTLVPRAILEKRRPLDHIEYATVKMHPDLGFQIVGRDVAPRVAAAVRHHHEWWNGTGYPARLASDEIPLEARIVGIADAFAAMRERRPYRAARSKQQAVHEVEVNAGTQFDPRLVEPLIESVHLDELEPRLRLLPRLFH